MNPLSLKLLFLLLAANGAPITLRKLLRERGAWPVDGAARWLDGRPLLGPSKTWRGLLAAPLATGLAAWLLGWPFLLGAQFGAYAMLGDLVSSFVKRRLGVASSGMALGLDQIPEALLPLLAVRAELGLAAADIAGLVLAFLALELALSRVLFLLRIREQPY
jgi:hypothetical protein